MTVMRFSDTWTEKLLDFVLGASPSANRYVALLATEAVPGDTGSTIVESDYGAYVRVLFDDSDWTATSNDRRKNEIAVQFAVVDTPDSVAVGVALLTAITAGELIAYQNFDSGDWRTFVEGDTPRFPINALAMAITALVDES